MNGLGMGGIGSGTGGAYNYTAFNHHLESLLNDPQHHPQQPSLNSTSTRSKTGSATPTTYQPSPSRNSQQQQQPQHQTYPSYFTDMYQLFNRPDSHTYDPNSSTTGRASTASSSAAQQHRLLVAAYESAATGGTDLQQQQHDASNTLAALLGLPVDYNSLLQHDQYSLLAGGPATAAAVASLSAVSSAKSQHQQANSNISAYPHYPHLLPTSNGLLDHHSMSLSKTALSSAAATDTITATSSMPSSTISNPYPNGVLSNQPSSLASRSVTADINSPSLFDSPALGPDETWLADISMTVPELALEPLSGVDIEKRIRNSMHDVITRYIPCVDFLVQCQQELRKGLEIATQPRRVTGRRSRGSSLTPQLTMTPAEFYTTYVDHLPKQFFNKNVRTMDSTALNESYTALLKLRDDARTCQRQTSEVVKNNFLGGMKDGESWGLRKWLSKYGNALAICTDLECILKACKKLDKSNPSTSKLAGLIRPMAKTALKKLHNDIPSSYQQRSTAHPYLPFFHRLEAALQGMSTFDPDEDDVICVDDSDDDDEIEIVKPDAAASSGVEATPAAVHKPQETITIVATPPRNSVNKRKHVELFDDDDDDDDEESDKQNANNNMLTGVDITDLVSPPLKRQATITTPLATTTTIPNNSNNRMDSFVTTRRSNRNNLIRHTVVTNNDDCSSSGESDDESLVQIVDSRPIVKNQVSNSTGHGTLGDEHDWTCETCFTCNPGAKIVCQGCQALQVSGTGDTGASTLFDCGSSMDSSIDPLWNGPKYHSSSNSIADSSTLLMEGRGNPTSWSLPTFNTRVAVNSSLSLAHNLIALAHMFDQNNYPAIRPVQIDSGSFWIGSRFADALRLFASLLRKPEASAYVEHIDDDILIKGGQPAFSHIIKHPICFRDIVAALICEGSGNKLATNGLASSESGGVLLSSRGLKKWNMWVGDDLIQAIDLVLLNSLAYSKALKQGKSLQRSRTNEMRKDFWKGVTDIVTSHVDNEKDKKRYTPTRRCESSGFVVYKITES